jgi:hypothetical protein
MFAPGVTQVIITFCGEVYIPGTGENTGFAIVPVILYKPPIISLSFQPALRAMAFKVVVAEIVSEYNISLKLVSGQCRLLCSRYLPPDSHK